MNRYDFQAIEEKWQERWEARGTFRTLAPGDAGFNGSKPIGWRTLWPVIRL